MPTFSSFDNNQKKEQQTVTQTVDLTDKQAKGAFLSKVYGWMFICLLITTVVAAGLGYGMMYILQSVASDEVLFSNIITGMVVTLIVSVIALLIMSFVLPITFIRGKHNIIVPLMIYVVLMGVLLSTFTWLFEPVILAEAFGITAIIFGLMALLGHLSKGRVAGIGVIMLGLIIGAGLLSLCNFVMILIGGIKPENVMLSWIVSLAIFAFLMFMTMWDVARITQIAGKGDTGNNNLVHYCAYILYSDFIALLVRVVYYLAIFTRRR